MSQSSTTTRLPAADHRSLYRLKITASPVVESVSAADVANRIGWCISQMSCAQSKFRSSDPSQIPIMFQCDESKSNVLTFRTVYDTAYVRATIARMMAGAAEAYCSRHRVPAAKLGIQFELVMLVPIPIDFTLIGAQYLDSTMVVEPLSDGPSVIESDDPL